MERVCTGQTHACDSKDLADSKVRRKVRRTAIYLAGILLAYFLQVIRGVQRIHYRGSLFSENPTGQKNERLRTGMNRGVAGRWRSRGILRPVRQGRFLQFEVHVE